MNQMNVVVSLFLLFVMAKAAQIASNKQQISNCKWRDDLNNLYDFSSLQRNESFWNVDLRATHNHTFKISAIFNFCTNFPQIAAYRKDIFESAHSIHTESSSAQVATDQGAIMQVSFKNMTTLTTGMGSYRSSIVGLMDFYDVGKGVKIIYQEGDICTQSENSNDLEKERTLTFMIYCIKRDLQEDNFISLPIDGISVTSCNPTLVIHHSAGCFAGQYSPINTLRLGRPVLFFVLLFVFIITSLTIVITIFNCTDNSLKGLDAIPFYNTFSGKNLSFQDQNDSLNL